VHKHNLPIVIYKTNKTTYYQHHTENSEYKKSITPKNRHNKLIKHLPLFLSKTAYSIYFMMSWVKVKINVIT